MMNDRRRITQSGGHNANRITGGIKRQLDLVYPTTTTLSPGTTTTNMNNTSTTTVTPQQQQQQSHKNNNNNGHSFQQPRPTFPLSNNNYTNNQQRATSFRSVNPQSSSSIYQNTYNNNTTNTNNNMEKKPFRCVPVPNQTPVTTTRTTTNFPNNNNSNTNTNTNTNNNSNNNNNNSNTNNENTRRFTSVPIPSTTTTTTAISHATTTNSNATTNMPRGYGSGRKAYFSATVPPSTTSSNSSSSSTSPNKPLLPTSPTTATSPSTIHTNNNNNAVVTSGWNNVNRRAFVPQQTSPPNTMKTSGGATSTTTTRGQFTMAPPPQTNYPKPTFARKNNNNASPPYSKIVSPQPQQQQQRSSFTTPVRTFKPVISPTSSHIQAQNQQSPTIANHSHNTSSILISPSNNTSEFMEDSIVVNVGGANDTMEPISSFADLGFMTSSSKNELSDSNAAAAMELKRMMEKLEEERHLLRSQLLDMQKQNGMIETKYKQERQTYESKLEYSNNENERLKKQEEETRRQFHEQLILEQKRIQELEQQQQQQKSSENEQYVEDMDLFDDFDLDAAQQRLNAQIAAQKEEPPVMNHRLESPLKNQQRAQAEPMEIDESTISLNNHSLSDSVILQTGRSSNLIPLMPRKDKYDETLYQLMFPLTQYSQKLFKKLFLKSSIRSIAPLVIEIMKSSIDNIHDESQIELNIALIEAAVDVLLLFFSKNRDAFDCIESMIGAQLIDGLDEPIKTEETNDVPPQAIFKNPRIKLGSAWEPSMPSISNDCLLFKSNTVIDSKVVQPIIDFSHLVTDSPKEDVDIKLNTVDLLLDFIKVLIQDDTLQLPRHLLGRATRALELTFSALRALASVDSPNIINSFKKFVTQDYLFAFPLDDMNLWKSLLHIFPPLLKHKCIVATLLDNEENVFSFLSDNLGIVREDIEEHQLLQVQHQIVQLFIFIVCNCEDGYDILLGRKQKTSSNSSSNQISSRQRDIMIANAVVLLSRQLYELENQSESSTELSKCDKLRITLIQELIKFLSIYGTEILPSTRKMVHIVKGIKVNLMERKTREQNSYNHRTKFAFDANIISYL